MAGSQAIASGGFSTKTSQRLRDNVKGSAAAADPLVEEVPLVVDMTLRRGYGPTEGNFGGSKLGFLGVFRAWDL